MLAVSLIGALLSFRFDFIGRGIFSFFLGGLCFYLATSIQRGTRMKIRMAQSLLAIIIFTTLSILTTELFFSLSSSLANLASVFLSKSVALPTMKVFLIGWVIKAVVFPALIMLLALTESELKPATQKLAWIGDITYSSYLVHFPLQLAFVLVSTSGLLYVDFSSRTTFLAYAVLLVALSIATFHFFERPAQDFLRRRLMPSSAAASGNGIP